MKRLPLGLLLAVLIYVGLRAAALWFAFDQVALTMYELYPMGTLARGLLIGADLPLRIYYDNAAGQLVTGALATPLYWLFGDGYLVLKLVPAILGLGMLLCVWSLLDRHVSRRAANLAALALAIGPAELLAKYSLIASGNHFENLFYSSLALWCFYRLHVAPPERYRRWLLASGVSAGLAVFVFLGAIIPVGILVGMHLGLRGWRGTGRDLRLGVPGFLAGISPLIVLNLLSSGRGASFLGAKFAGKKSAERDWSLVAGRVQDFFMEGFPSSGFFNTFGGESLAIPNWTLVIVIAAAWLALAPEALRAIWSIARALTGGARPQLEALFVLPFFLLPPLAALAYGLSDLRIGDGNWGPRLGVAGYRYYLPVFLFGTVMVALVSDRLLAKGGARRMLAALLLAGLFGSGVWNLAWLRTGTPGVGAHYQGYNFTQAARGLFNKTVGLSHERRLEIAASLPAPHRAHLYRGMGLVEAQLWVLLNAKSSGRPSLDLVRTVPLPIEEIVLRYPEAARLDVARGAGTGLRSFVAFGGQGEAKLKLTAQGLETLVAAGSPWAYPVLEGAAWTKDFLDPWSEVPRVLGRSRRLLELLPEPLRATYARGLGEVCGRYLARTIPAEERFIEGFLHRTFALGGKPLLAGVGRGLALGSMQPQLTDGARAAVPVPEYWAQVERGFEAALQALDG